MYPWFLAYQSASLKPSIKEILFNNMHFTGFSREKCFIVQEIKINKQKTKANKNNMYKCQVK